MLSGADRCCQTLKGVRCEETLSRADRCCQMCFGVVRFGKILLRVDVL